MKKGKNSNRFLLLWLGELVSSIGGGLIGFLSQLGYVVSYAVSGAAADWIGAVTGRGVGRGAAAVILASGVCLTVIALSVFFPRSIQALEKQSIKEEQQ